MGTRENRLFEAVLTNTNNLCFEQKYETNLMYSYENCYSYNRENTLYCIKRVNTMVCRTLHQLLTSPMFTKFSGCLRGLGVVASHQLLTSTMFTKFSCKTRSLLFRRVIVMVCSHRALHQLLTSPMFTKLS